MKATLCLISMTLSLIAPCIASGQAQQSQQQSQQSQQSQQAQQSQQPYPGSAAAAARPPAASPADPTRPELHQRYPRYKIGANDVMDLTFRYTPEFNQEVMVQPDGYVQLRGLPADGPAQGLPNV